MRSKFCASIVLCLLVCWAGVQALDYPLTFGAAAQVTKGATTVTTTFTIHVDREMNETFRSRVMDALEIRRLSQIPFGAPLSASDRHDRVRGTHGRTALRARGASRERQPARPRRRSPAVFSRRPGESSSRLRADDGRDDARRAGRGHRHHDGRGAREANTRGRPRRR